MAASFTKLIRESLKKDFSDCNNLGNTELKILTDLNVVIKEITLCYAKPNQKKRIIPENMISNEGINSQLNSVTKTALSLGPT